MIQRLNDKMKTTQKIIKRAAYYFILTTLLIYFKLKFLLYCIIINKNETIICIIGFGQNHFSISTFDRNLTFFLHTFLSNLFSYIIIYY